MKATTGIFGLGLSGIVLALVMTVVTAVRDHRASTEAPTHAIVVPAEVR